MRSVQSNLVLLIISKITLLNVAKNKFVQRINISILLALLFSNTINAQTFLNGSFENTTVNTDQINMTSPAFNLAMTNTFSFGSYGDMDIITSATWGAPQNGSWFVGLTGGGTDIISLKLSTALIAGKSYTITFFDRGFSAFPVYPVQLGLSTVNNTVGTIIYTGPTPTLGVWTQRTATFVAPNNGMYISVLMNAGTVSNWVNVDNFTLLNPLPVELLSFKGENKNNVNHLHWATASEMNNEYFEIERSSNGLTFTKIGTVNGQGNCYQISNYDFDDLLPLDGINYYRLKQVDINGEFKYSSIISVNVSFKNEIVVMPNPFSTSTTIAFNVVESSTVSIAIYDANATEIKNVLQKNIHSGNNVVTIDLSAMSHGVYYCKINSDGQTETVKLIKN